MTTKPTLSEALRAIAASAETRAHTPAHDVRYVLHEAADALDRHGETRIESAPATSAARYAPTSLDGQALAAAPPAAEPSGDLDAEAERFYRALWPDGLTDWDSGTAESQESFRRVARLSRSMRAEVELDRDSWKTQAEQWRGNAQWWKDWHDAARAEAAKWKREFEALREANAILANASAEAARLKHERDMHVRLSEDLKLALDRPGLDRSYVEWAGECRAAYDELASLRAAAPVVMITDREALCDDLMGYLIGGGGQRSDQVRDNCQRVIQRHSRAADPETVAKAMYDDASRRHGDFPSWGTSAPPNKQEWMDAAHAALRELSLEAKTGDAIVNLDTIMDEACRSLGLSSIGALALRTIIGRNLRPGFALGAQSGEANGTQEKAGADADVDRQTSQTRWERTPTEARDASDSEVQGASNPQRATGQSSVGQLSAPATLHAAPPPPPPGSTPDWSKRAAKYPLDSLAQTLCKAASVMEYHANREGGAAERMTLQEIEDVLDGHDASAAPPQPVALTLTDVEFAKGPGSPSVDSYRGADPLGSPAPSSGEWTEALAQKDEWIDRLRDAVKDAVESVERTPAQCCGTSMLHTVQVSSTQVALWRAALRVEGEVRP